MPLPGSAPYIDRMSMSARLFLCDRDILVTVAYFAVILAIPQQAFASGREGHQRAVTGGE